MIQVVDLFSCVGAHHLGWELASRIASAQQSSGDDFQTPFDPEFVTVMHCESRPFRRAVLHERFPFVPVHPDVRELDLHHMEGLIDERHPVAVVGGPPCQNTSPISSISGSRTQHSLVGEQVRIAAGLEADWCVVEQPADTPVWEERAVGLLTGAGYYVGRLEFSAGELGAPYQRRRVYLLACAERRGLEVAVDFGPRAVEAVRASSADSPPGRGWSYGDLRALRVDVERTTGVDASGRVFVKRDRSDRRDRIEALGDSNPPEMMAVVALCLMAAHGSVVI